VEVELQHGSKSAERILELRKDSNFLLTTILWGNVGINVMLAMLSDSVLSGVLAFLFSTFIITIFGEILPQAYFSRNALRMASMLAPVLRFYQFLLYPVTRPSARVLDAWLGKEGIEYFREQELVTLIRAHIESADADVDQVEGIGALNFLTTDDVTVIEEGELVDEKSVIRLPTTVDMPLIPDIDRTVNDPFLQQINESGHPWVVLADEQGNPQLILDADAALRAALFKTEEPFDIYNFCRRPLVIRDTRRTIGDVITYLKSLRQPNEPDDSSLDYDAVLVWTNKPRIITGADILGKLLKGISPEIAPSIG